MTLVMSKGNNNVPHQFSDFFGSDVFHDDFFNQPVLKWLPAVNIRESQSQFLVELSAPGLTKSDFKVEVNEDVLSIEANKEEEKSEKNERYTRKEFLTSSFMRSFRLPQSIKEDAIDAKYENGILKLVLPKREESKDFGPKQVKIS